MTCEEVYQTGLLYHHYANTAYPLTPTSFMQYKLSDKKEIFDFVRDEWKNVEELALYIHVPFCMSRCKFCEYVVIENPTEEMENEYVSLLLKEMEMYARILKKKRIIGYDLGGGTPAKLSVSNLKKITDAVHDLFLIKENVEFSIETTPIIAAKEPEKIKAIFDMGYRRISMGVQTVSEKLLLELGRDGSKSIYEKAVANIREAGYESFNIDLMYGFLNQSERDFDNTLHYAIGLKPDYITLYRNRYKGTKIEYEAGGVSIYKAMYQYRIAHRVLTENGYEANVGKNTFSRIDGNYGTSDYLTTRVIYGMPYVGLGLGAQSFGSNYLAYNLGAAEKKMERYKEAVSQCRLPLQDIYRLPIEETMAKMISVAFYFGFIDMAAFKMRFGVDFREQFGEEIQFVLDNHLMEIRDSRMYLTDRGADYINGVIPLFYSAQSKEELKKAFQKEDNHGKSDEALFLDTYRITDFDRPSVTADIAVFAQQIGNGGPLTNNDHSGKMSVLLIRRGEHPYMNCWALPGGFLRADETVEECALREIKEETGIDLDEVMPVGVYSDCKRDPRGRIISHAFAAVIRKEDVSIWNGDDAIDAKWFDVTLEENPNGSAALAVNNGSESFVSKLQFSVNSFGKLKVEMKQDGGLAFDHAVMIAEAYMAVQGSDTHVRRKYNYLDTTGAILHIRRN